LYHEKRALPPLQFLMIIVPQGSIVKKVSVRMEGGSLVLESKKTKSREEKGHTAQKKRA